MEYEYNKMVYVDLDIVNMLSDLYMGMGHFEKAYEIITQTQKKYSQAMPLELNINYGICLAFLGRLSEAHKIFANLLQHDILVYGDLYFTVAETYFALGELSNALEFYNELTKHPDYNLPPLWIKQARCYEQLQRKEDAISTYQKVFEYDKSNDEACLALAELMPQIGQAREALRIVDEYLAPKMREESLPLQDYRILTHKAFLHFILGEYEKSLEVSLLIIEECFRQPLEHRRRKKRRTQGTENEKDNEMKRVTENMEKTNESTTQITASSKERTQPGDNEEDKNRELNSNVTDNVLAVASMGIDLPSISASSTQFQTQTQTQTQTQFQTQQTHLSMEEEPQVEHTANQGEDGEIEQIVERLLLEAITEQQQEIALEATSLHSTINNDGSKTGGMESATLPLPSLQNFEQNTTSLSNKVTVLNEPNNTNRNTIPDIDDTNPSANVAISLGEPSNVDVNAPATSNENIDETQKAPKRQASVFDMIGPRNYYQLVMNSTRILAYMGRVVDAKELIIEALDLMKKSDKAKLEREFYDRMQFLAAKLSYLVGDYASANLYARRVCANHPYNITLWNFFYKVTMRTSQTYSTRYLLRLVRRNPNCLPIIFLLGHHSIAAGSNKAAANEYLRAYKIRNDLPIISLCLGIAFLNQVMSRKTADRHKCALQAFAFLFRYKQLRNHNQESVYNLARAFHHLNLTHFAVGLYEQVLNWPTDDNENHLKREAAFNLSLIYRASGNNSLARKLLQDYVTI